MSEDRFKIVFEKLAEVGDETGEGSGLTREVEELGPELDELAELRRLTETMMEPPSGSYTST